MNRGAGIGDLLLIAVHLKGGGDLPFILDTGAPLTLLDTSLAQTLGKEVGAEKIFSMYGQTAGQYYKAPEIYVGEVQLRTGRRVLTMDLSRLSGDVNRLTGSNHRFKGILGMDALWHYCIQLDFTARQIRFLDPYQLHVDELGQALPLIPDAEGCPLVVRGKDSHVLVDTGCIDKRATNLLGLDFLARHLVTFNFPKRTMYLKPTSVSSRADERLSAQANQSPRANRRERSRFSQEL
jgi:hypothetical protein